MTLLLVETARVDAVFGDLWRGWLRQRGWEPPADPRRAAFDHFPFLLYEHFATAPMAAARDIALAARAMGMASHLEQAPLPGRDRPPAAESAVWLRALACARLESVIPPAAPFWRSFAPDGPASCAAAPASALAPVAGPAGPLPLVHESQTHLYAALALYEGCLWWRDDYLRRRPSEVVARLCHELDGAAAVSPDEAGRRFYYGGLAERVLDEAGEHLCRALAAVTDLPPVGWGAMLSRRLTDVTALRTDIRRIRRDQVARSGVQPATPRRTGTGPPPVEPAAAAEAAASYVRREQAPEGWWGDFMLLGQQSTSWVTGYVGWNLALSDPDGGDLRRAAHWLATNQLPGEGWGYNRHWPVDADSLANVLLFLSTRGRLAEERWSPALEHLMATQHDDGSFTTILDPEAWIVRFRSGTPSVSGWTASHPCVTAVAALLLARLGGERERAAATRALDYLLARQRPDGHWDAYWWMGGLYTTCRVLEALAELRGQGEPHPAEAGVGRATAWLLGGQRPDGGWGAAGDGPSLAFHTALAVQALRALSPTVPVVSAAAAGRRWLVAHQRPDGSWPAAPILRVPRPETLAPWDQATWTESIVGLDVVVPDWRRLFTTVTALRALYSCAAGGEDIADGPRRATLRSAGRDDA